MALTILVDIVGAVSRGETDTRKLTTRKTWPSFSLQRELHMTRPVRSQDFIQPVRNPRLFQRLLNALITMLASPKGDQGSWEGGCRGL